MRLLHALWENPKSFCCCTFTSHYLRNSLACGVHVSRPVSLRLVERGECLYPGRRPTKAQVVRRSGEKRQFVAGLEGKELREAVGALFPPSRRRACPRARNFVAERRHESAGGDRCRVQQRASRDFYFDAAAGVWRPDKTRGQTARVSNRGHRRRLAVSRRTQSRGRALFAGRLRLDDETTVNKTATTLHVPAPTRRENPRLAQWKEAREVFPIYLALAKQQEIDIPFPQATRNLPEQPDTALFTQVHEWLEARGINLIHHITHANNLGTTIITVWWGE